MSLSILSKANLALFIGMFWVSISPAQDTFSIVALDSVTGEVGSAGASCVNLFSTPFPNDDFLGQLLPDVGAINTQAFYLQANQANAFTRLQAGETPDQIIQWLVANDINGQPQLRQYGIVAFVNGQPESAAYTGTQTNDYKGQIVGPNYAIQGNILLGQQVLDSMEARFLREPGDLACKLMAALQGAKVVGADTRCTGNGTSSLFAFVKVAQPTDQVGIPSFNLGVRTAANAGIEPVDSLQVKFDQVKSCTVTALDESEDFDRYFSVYPNPAGDVLFIENKSGQPAHLYLIDSAGRIIRQEVLQTRLSVSTAALEPGMYALRLAGRKGIFVKKVVVE